jgi:hypothetical protein
MRKNILRIIFVFALAAICLVIYFIGYGRGHKAAVYDRLVYDVRSDLHLYKLLEAGDTNQLQSTFRFFVFRDADYYDRYFSGKTVTNQYFIKDLTDARIIASQERTQVVSLDVITQQFNERLQTNRSPDQ